MATSGTYLFDPEVVSFIEEAFERCGVDPASLTGRHVKSARLSLAFLFSEWNNKGPHLWAVDQQSQILTQADSEYTAPSGTIAVLEMVLRRSGVDTPIYPMSRDQYLALSNKTTSGMPNRFYFDRSRTSPTFILWPSPENSTDTIYFYRMRSLQDVGTATNTLDIPSRWYEAVASGLAAKLAVKYAPDRIGPLKGEARDQLHEAKQEDRQRVPTQMRVRYSV